MDLVEVDLVAGAVVELGGFWGFVVGDLLGVLDGAAAFEVGSDAGRPEGVATVSSGKPAALARRLILRKASLRCIGRAVSVRCVSMVRKGGLLPGDACGVEIGIDVFLGVVVGGHLMPLAAFVMQAEPGPRVPRS